MNSSERAGHGPESVDIENIMQEVRQEILERELPGTVLLPRTATNLPSEYYEHLYHAALSQGNRDIDLVVTPSKAPIIGPLIDRLRVKFHELVVFYVGQFADKQAETNNHILQALSALGRMGAEDSAIKPPGSLGYALAPRSEWATAEDVHACYRLLLGREPDKEGWDYWTSLVKDHYLTQGFLVDSFLNGAEFRALHDARNNPVLVELPGFKMYVRLNDNFIGAVIARDKQYEAHVTRVLGEQLSHGSTFIDVGANIGYFSLLAASIVGPAGRVIAFEPDQANCDLLRASMAANNFEKVIELQPFAVAEARQRLRFTPPGIDSNGRVVNTAELANGGDTLVTVEAVALDELLADIDRVDVIKLDIEGAEARAWRGMQNLVQRHRPKVLFEFSPILLRQTSQIDPAAFLAEVEKAGYELFIITPEGDTGEKPDTIEAILEQYAASGLTHLDLFARPQRQAP